MQTRREFIGAVIGMVAGASAVPLLVGSQVITKTSAIGPTTPFGKINWIVHEGGVKKRKSFGYSITGINEHGDQVTEFIA